MCVPTSGFPALTQIAAALASSSLVFQQSDKKYANTLYYAAASLYGRVSDPTNQGLYSSVAQPNCRNPGDPLEVRPPPHSTRRTQSKPGPACWYPTGLMTGCCLSIVRGKHSN